MSTSLAESSQRGARCLLKWLSEQMQNQKLTEVLKNRVVRIKCEGDESKFSMDLKVNGEYARKILEMKRVSILDCLRQGYIDQCEMNLETISFEILK